MLIISKKRQKKKPKETNTHELDHYKEKNKTKYVYSIMYNLDGREYLEIEKRFLTLDELEEINGKLIDEKDVD